MLSHGDFSLEHIFACMELVWIYKYTNIYYLNFFFLLLLLCGLYLCIASFSSWPPIGSKHRQQHQKGTCPVLRLQTYTESENDGDKSLCTTVYWVEAISHGWTVLWLQFQWEETHLTISFDCTMERSTAGTLLFHSGPVAKLKTFLWIVLFCVNII